MIVIKSGKKWNEMSETERNELSNMNVGSIAKEQAIKQKYDETEKLKEPSELDGIKQKIKEANIRYRESIDRNKALYRELELSRKAKEECRNEIASLRKQKKKLLGITDDQEEEIVEEDGTDKS